MGRNPTRRFPCWLLLPPPPNSVDSPVSPLPFFPLFLAKTDCNIRVLSSQFPYDGGSRNAN